MADIAVTSDGSPSVRRVRIDEYLVEYSDAIQEVELERTVLDIITAKPGRDGECMNARCIIRNSQSFPHPVFLASVAKSRVYIVDRVNSDGTPAHAIKYVLTQKDSELIQRHDEQGVGEPGTLRLRPPTGTDRAGAIKNVGGVLVSMWPKGKRYGRGEKPKRPLHRGARQRMLVAVGAGMSGDVTASTQRGPTA